MCICVKGKSAMYNIYLGVILFISKSIIEGVQEVFIYFYYEVKNT